MIPASIKKFAEMAVKHTKDMEQQELATSLQAALVVKKNGEPPSSSALLPSGWQAVPSLGQICVLPIP